MAEILVLAEHSGGDVKKVTSELLITPSPSRSSTLKKRAASLRISSMSSLPSWLASARLNHFTMG